MPHIKTVTIACLLLIAVVSAISAYMLLRPHYFTVAQAWAQRNDLRGLPVTIRGYARPMWEQTLVLCRPKRCDCNTTGARTLWLADEGDAKRAVAIDLLDCLGDECTATCRPIDPTTKNQLEFTGILRIEQEGTPYPYLRLDQVSTDRARENLAGTWQPIATGVFQIPLPRPLNPNPVYSFDQFTADLRAAGAKVELPSDSTVNHGFEIPGRRIVVNGENLYVYVFADAPDALIAAEGVAPDGTAITRSDAGKTVMTQGEWTSPPHFYRKAEVLVIYAGEDASMKTLLVRLLGAQFAGSP